MVIAFLQAIPVRQRSPPESRASGVLQKEELAANEVKSEVGVVDSVDVDSSLKKGLLSNRLMPKDQNCNPFHDLAEGD